MKKLIKFFQTPRKNIVVYIYRSIEDDASTQELYSKVEADAMVEAGEAEIFPYEGSYLDVKEAENVEPN